MGLEVAEGPPLPARHHSGGGGCGGLRLGLIWSPRTVRGYREQVDRTTPERVAAPGVISDPLRPEGCSALRYWPVAPVRRLSIVGRKSPITMRKILAPILIGLGAFLVVAAVIAQVWAPGQIERTPLDTDNTTYLSGSAQVAGGDDLSLQESPVLAFSVNQVDADASDDDVVAWTTSLCVVRDEGDIDGCVDADDPEGRLVSAETEVFATDRTRR